MRNEKVVNLTRLEMSRKNVLRNEYIDTYYIHVKV